MDQFEDDSPIEIVGKTSGSLYFDCVIGHIEDIVLADEFHCLQQTFLEKYWMDFENSDENKLEYMNIFEEYNKLFENYFMQELHKRMDDFDMEKFAEELNDQQQSLDIDNFEIFEILHSITDFQTFKQLMLDYRNQKEGKTQHLDVDILTTKSLQIANENLQNYYQERNKFRCTVVKNEPYI